MPRREIFPVDKNVFLRTISGMRQSSSVLNRFLARLVHRFPAARRVLRRCGWQPRRPPPVCRQLEFLVISKF
jgi:hypothetical protein